MNILKKIPATIIATSLSILFPFFVFTFITSKTDALLNIRSFAVLSGSMEPKFPVGSIVYSQKKSNYKPGETITFKTPADQNVTHRIYSVEKKNNEITYITKGDANNNIDTLPVKPPQIIGKVFFFVPYLGKLVSLLKAPAYFFGIIIVPSIIFIAIELWAIKNEIVRSTEKRVLENLKSPFDIQPI